MNLSERLLRKRQSRQLCAHRVGACRSGMSTFSFILGSVLWFLVLAAVWYLALQKRKDAAPVGPESETAAVVEATEEMAIEAKPKSVVISFPSRELPEFEFPECMGGTISRESLRGQRWLASFVFTRCVETCPVITRSVSELHTRVARSNPDFRFVTFSVDSSFDSAEVLQKYAETFRADHERWKFLTGDENEIHDLIRRGFAQFVQTNLGEMRKPGFEVAHSNRAVLVNEDGIPVATYLMTDPEHVVRLRRVIEGKEEFPQPGPTLQITPADGENPVVPLNIVPVEDKDAAESSVPAGADAPEAEDANESKDVSECEEPGENSGAEARGSDDQDSSPGDAAATDSDESSSLAADQLSPVDQDTVQDSAESRNWVIEAKLPLWVARLPTVNAVLNSVCTLLLLVGYAAIRSGRRDLHRNLMIIAFVVSVVFLGCYLTYHEALFRFTGLRGRAFVGSDVATFVYRSILIPHVILAVFVPILAIRVFVHAYRERWPEHRWLAKITLPIWLFVSITGVIIYGMLYHFNALTTG